MNQPLAPQSREALLTASKEELVDLLLLALEGHKMATENMQELLALLNTTQTTVKELEDKLASMEAELIVHRNRPA